MFTYNLLHTSYYPSKGRKVNLLLMSSTSFWGRVCQFACLFPFWNCVFLPVPALFDRFPGRRIDGCWRRLPFKMPAGLFRMVRFLVVAEGVIFLPLHVKNMLRMEVRLEKGVRMELGEGHEYALVKVIADGAESLLGGFGCRAGGKDGKRFVRTSGMVLEGVCPAWRSGS